MVMVAGACLAQKEIGPGSPAPELSIKKWLKGEKVEKLEKGKTYVVEFWATWCGPCIQAMPHVTELAKKNPDVTFIGAGIWEDDKDGVLEAFVEKMGDKIGYNLGYSGNQDGMSETWMKAAGQNGIPSAFIIKDGIIQWIGHPMSMDEPLAQVKAGTFDLAAFKAQYDERAKAQRAQQALMAKVEGIQEQFKKGERKEAHAALDAIEKENSQMKPMLDDIRFGWLAVENEAGWTAEATKRADSDDMNVRMSVFMFAMNQTEEGGNLKLGKKAMEIALKSKKSDGVIDNYYAAIFYRQTKDYKAAAKHADALIAAAKKSETYNNEDTISQFEALKKQIEKDLAASNGN